MNHLDTFLTPGEIALEWLFLLLGISSHSQDPQIVLVFAGLISFLFWLCVMRFVGQLALKILGIERKGRY